MVMLSPKIDFCCLWGFQMYKFYLQSEYFAKINVNFVSYSVVFITKANWQKLSGSLEIIAMG
jgi:hypothetical protein